MFLFKMGQHLTQFPKIIITFVLLLMSKYRVNFCFPGSYSLFQRITSKVRQFNGLCDTKESCELQVL